MMKGADHPKGVGSSCVERLQLFCVLGGLKDQKSEYVIDSCNRPGGLYPRIL